MRRRNLEHRTSNIEHQTSNIEFDETTVFCGRRASFWTCACGGSMNCNEAASDAPASWTAAVLCRFCARGPDLNAPADWRSPKPGGAATGSWKASIRFRACIGTMNRGKRRQAGRTPNASRSPRRSATARQRLECVEIAPAFARGSWKGDREKELRTLKLELTAFGPFLYPFVATLLPVRPAG